MYEYLPLVKGCKCSTLAFVSAAPLQKRLDHVMAPSLSLGLDPETHQTSQAVRSRPKPCPSQTELKCLGLVQKTNNFWWSTYLVISIADSKAPQDFPGCPRPEPVPASQTDPRTGKKSRHLSDRGLFNFQMGATQQHHQIYYNISSSNSKCSNLEPVC